MSKDIHKITLKCIELQSIITVSYVEGIMDFYPFNYSKQIEIIRTLQDYLKEGWKNENSDIVKELSIHLYNRGMAVSESAATTQLSSDNNAEENAEENQKILQIFTDLKAGIEQIMTLGEAVTLDEREEIFQLYADSLNATVNSIHVKQNKIDEIIKFEICENDMYKSEINKVIEIQHGITELCNFGNTENDRHKIIINEILHKQKSLLQFIEDAKSDSENSATLNFNDANFSRKINDQQKEILNLLEGLNSINFSENFIETVKFKQRLIENLQIQLIEDVALNQHGNDSTNDLKSLISLYIDEVAELINQCTPVNHYVLNESLKNLKSEQAGINEFLVLLDKNEELPLKKLLEKFQSHHQQINKIIKELNERGVSSEIISEVDHLQQSVRTITSVENKQLLLEVWKGAELKLNPESNIFNYSQDLAKIHNDLTIEAALSNRQDTKEMGKRNLQPTTPSEHALVKAGICTVNELLLIDHELTYILAEGLTEDYINLYPKLIKLFEVARNLHSNPNLGIEELGNVGEVRLTDLLNLDVMEIINHGLISFNDIKKIHENEITEFAKLINENDIYYYNKSLIELIILTDSVLSLGMLINSLDINDNQRKELEIVLSIIQKDNSKLSQLKDSGVELSESNIKTLFVLLKDGKVNLSDFVYFLPEFALFSRDALNYLDLIIQAGKEESLSYLKTILSHNAYEAILGHQNLKGEKFNPNLSQIILSIYQAYPDSINPTNFIPLFSDAKISNGKGGNILRILLKQEDIRKNWDGDFDTDINQMVKAYFGPEVYDKVFCGKVPPNGELTKLGVLDSSLVLSLYSSDINFGNPKYFINYLNSLKITDYDNKNILNILIKKYASTSLEPLIEVIQDIKALELEHAMLTNNLEVLAQHLLNNKKLDRSSEDILIDLIVQGTYQPHVNAAKFLVTENNFADLVELISVVKYKNKSLDIFKPLFLASNQEMVFNILTNNIDQLNDYQARGELLSDEVSISMYNYFSSHADKLDIITLLPFISNYNLLITNPRFTNVRYATQKIYDDLILKILSLSPNSMQEKGIYLIINDANLQAGKLPDLMKIIKCHAGRGQHTVLKSILNLTAVTPDYLQNFSGELLFSAFHGINKKAMLKTLIDSGKIDLNAKCDWGGYANKPFLAYVIEKCFSALAVQKDFSLAEMLINVPRTDVNVDITTKDKYQTSNDKLIFYALKTNNIPLAKSLLKNPSININEVNSNDISILQYVADAASHNKNYKDLLELTLGKVDLDTNILFKEAFVTQSDTSELSLLSYLIDNNKTELVEMVLKHPNTKIYNGNKENIGNHPLLKACSSESTDILNCILTHPSFDINQKDSENGELIVSKLLEQISRLPLANDFIQYIVSSTGFTELRIEDPKEMELYLSIVYNINDVVEINDEMVERMIQVINKDSLNTKDESGQTILSKCIQKHENNNFLKAILKHGGGVAIEGDNDMSILVNAFFYNNPEGLKIVIKYSEDEGIDIKDSKLKFAEHIITCFWSNKIAPYLEILNLSTSELENIYQKVYAEEALKLQRVENTTDQSSDDDFEEVYDYDYVPTTVISSNNGEDEIDPFAVFNDGFPENFNDGFEPIKNMGDQLHPSNT